jgi:hypothetical protein
MHPKGHLVTSAVLSGGILAATQSVELAAGAFAGGFLIDLDHYFDYFVFNKQRDPRPRPFLEYYLNNRFNLVVLPLHAYELMAVLGGLAFFFPNPLLIGYLIGAAMHMGLDLHFNQECVGSTVPFYSFIYRAKNKFLKKHLLRGPKSAEIPARKAESSASEASA